MSAHSSRSQLRVNRGGLGGLIEREGSEGTLVCRLHSQETLPLPSSFSRVLWGLGLQPSLCEITPMKCKWHWRAKNLHHLGPSVLSRTRIILVVIGH